MAKDRLSNFSSTDSQPPQTRGRSFSSSTFLGCIVDLVLWYLPVRTLVQCKVFNKEWRAWCDENLLQIANKRRKDESKSDWYFPLAFEDRRQIGLYKSWNWYGVHHETKERHTLPSLDFLPYGTPRAPHFNYELEAISSGLLVLSNVITYDNSLIAYDNSILIVCNPLSKKWKRLPVHGYCQDTWMYHTHLVLGDLPNEYRVIRLSTQCIHVYSSSTERWVCAPYDPCIGFHESSSVCFKGQMYILFKLMEGIPFHSSTLRWRYNLWIYNIETGTYKTKSFTSSTVVPQDCIDFHETSNVTRSPRDPILVMCMGNLYAVAASRRVGRNHVKPRKQRETYVANCEFHIFKLMEEGRLLDGSWKHVVTIPVVLCSVKEDVLDFWKACLNFSCVARSNTICLAWTTGNHRDDYLHVNYLEYDVVSSLHTTYTIRAHHGEFSLKCSMAYIPCLDLEP